MNLKPLSTLFILIFPILLNAQNKNYNLLIGTYTNTGKSEGIYVYTFNVQTGEFSYRSKAIGIENPSYLAISQDKKHVYSVNEGGKGFVSAFDFKAATGKLTFLNRVSSGGEAPCYVTVDDRDKYVFAGNYGGGNLAAIPLKPDGSLSNDIQIIQHEGSSINKSRQEKPHVHSTVLSPDNRYLFTADLGTDQLNIYHLDGSNKQQALTPAKPAFISVKAGSGPRHLTFHPNGKFAYLIQEMGGLVTFFDYKDGKLTEKQSITMISENFKGKIGAADIHISPDGKFLYGSNRGDANDLVIYSIDKSGNLKFIGRQSTLGKNPRNFSIDPTGNFLLVAHQSSDDILIFRRNQKTGLLTPTGKKIEVGAPVCLKFVAID